jgi:hypothetical protein
MGRRWRGQKLFVSNIDMNGTIMTFKYLECITGVMDKETDFFNNSVYNRTLNSIFNNAMIS